MVERAYDATAELYLKKKGRFGYRQLLVRVNKMLPKGARILDVGCGTGGVARFFSGKGHSVTGVDNSGEMVAICRGEVPSAKFLKGNMLELDFKKGSFDAVLAFFSLIHISKRSVPKMLRKFAGFLKPGGILAMGVVEGKGEYVYPLHYSPRNKIFGCAFGEYEMKKLIRGAGFRLVFSGRRNITDELFGREGQLYFIARKGE